MALDETSTPQQSKDWLEDRKLVLHELTRLGDVVEKIDEKLDNQNLLSEKRIGKIHTEVATLKAKASTWGAVAGTVFGIITAILVKILG